MYAKLFFLLVFASVFFTSCLIEEKALSTSYSDNNKEYEIDYLFEFEGVDVYRFQDRGNYVYLTIPSSNVTSIAIDSTAQRVVTIGR